MTNLELSVALQDYLTGGSTRIEDVLIELSDREPSDMVVRSIVRYLCHLRRWMSVDEPVRHDTINRFFATGSITDSDAYQRETAAHIRELFDYDMPYYEAVVPEKKTKPVKKAKVKKAAKADPDPS